MILTSSQKWCAGTSLGRCTGISAMIIHSLCFVDLAQVSREINKPELNHCRSHQPRLNWAGAAHQARSVRPVGGHGQCDSRLDVHNPHAAIQGRPSTMPTTVKIRRAVEADFRRYAQATTKEPRS